MSRRRSASTASVLVFTNGASFGLSELAADLCAKLQDPHRPFRFASHANGLAALRARGIAAYDLSVPRSPLFLAAQGKAIACIQEFAPKAILAFEEFHALAAGLLLDIPAIYVGRWLPPAGSVETEALTYASAMAVCGATGVFAVPAGAPERRLLAAGGLAVRTTPQPARRPQPRHRCALAVVALGTQSDLLVDRIVSAFLALAPSDKSLEWTIADATSPLLRKRLTGIDGVTVHEYSEQTEARLCCADLIVCIDDLALSEALWSRGQRCIHISSRVSPIEETLTLRSRLPVALFADATPLPALIAHFESCLRTNNERRPVYIAQPSLAAFLKAELGRWV